MAKHCLLLGALFSSAGGQLDLDATRSVLAQPLINETYSVVNLTHVKHVLVGDTEENEKPFTQPSNPLQPNFTKVVVRNQSTIQGGHMEVARGPLQRLTDPWNFQRPWTALLFLIGDIYVFFGLHIVVHHRFSIAMEQIVELSGMSEDIAGATLLAIGTSLPEVLCGAVGVFVPGAGEAGLGTVVGSLIFNMLVITGRPPHPARESRGSWPCT